MVHLIHDQVLHARITAQDTQDRLLHQEVTRVTVNLRAVRLHPAVHPEVVIKVVGRHPVAHPEVVLAEVHQEAQEAQEAAVVVVAAEDNICLTKESLKQ